MVASLGSLGCAAAKVPAHTDPAPSLPVRLEASNARTSDSNELWTTAPPPVWYSKYRLSDIAPLDDERAIGLSADDALLSIDLRSGVIVAHPGAFGRAGSPAKLLRAGGRVLAYGTASAGTPMVWSVEPSTLAVSPLALPATRVSVDPARRSSVELALSPDGLRVFVCGAERAPSLHSADSFAVIESFPGVTVCGTPRFIDHDHVRLDKTRDDAVVLDLGTGKWVAEPAHAATTLPAAGGRTASIEGHQLLTVRDPNGRHFKRHGRHPFFRPQWLGDGSALVEPSRDGLNVVSATADLLFRTEPLPLVATELYPIPLSSSVVITSGGHHIGVVDTLSGRLRTAPNTNRDQVTRIGTVDGAVISVSDRLRVWRQGRLLATGEPIHDGVSSVQKPLWVGPGGSVEYATDGGVFSTTLSGVTTTLAEESLGSVFDREGERSAWQSTYGVMLRVGEKEPFVLFGVGSRWSLGALDLSTDRAAFYDENGYCLARTEQRTVFAFHTRECGAPGELWLERGRERAVAVSFGGEVTSVELYDTALEKELAGVGVGDFVEMVAFIPGSDLVLLAASELYIWDPGSAEVLEWQPPAQLENVSVNALGVDPNGSALALGFVNGDVAWLTLDTLRAQTHAADPELVAELPARVNCDKPLATSFAAMTSDDELPPEPSVGDAGEEGAE